jgi:hypothetical protein
MTVSVVLSAVLLVCGGGRLHAQLSGAYTINSAVTTGGTNYQTFAAAVSALVTNGVSGPVVFDVVPSSGPYTEHISIGAITGVSATNTVTFNGNGNTLQYAPSSSDKSVVDINGADYLIFDNLTVAGTNATYGFGFLLRNASDHITIQNCTIDLTAITSTTSTNSAHIAASASLTTPISAGNNANYLTVVNNTLTGAPYYGIVTYGSSSAIMTTYAIEGNTISAYYYAIRLYYTTIFSIRNNIVQDFYYYGIHCTYATAGCIGSNDISRPTRSSVTTTYSIYLYTSCSADTVEKNLVHNMFDAASSSTSTFYGIAVTSSGSSAAYNLVRNNAVYNILGEGTQYGVYTSGGNYVQVYHNTIALENTASASTSTTYGWYTSGTTAPGPDFKNNIVSITRGGTGTKYCIYISSTGAGASNYNDLYMGAASGTANYTGYYNAVTYATLANWQTANANAYDQNSVAAIPSFESPATGNLKPQELALNDIGTDLTAYVADDILGNARTTTPDPGAWEFTPVTMTVTGTVTTQPNTDPVAAGASDELIIGIEVTTSGSAAPLSATQFSLSTNGTTSATGDLDSAKVYYTGTSAAFATGTLFGGVASPSGAFAVTGAQTLASGTNYFWVAYKINSAATLCNVVDAECSSITISATPYTPTPTAPAGSRTIRQAFSGAYTVNSAATPGCGVYTSISQIVADLTVLGVSGPVTVNVAASSGPYTEHVSIPPIPGASATNTITINGNGNTLQYAPTAADLSIIDMNGCDYVTITNLTVTGLDATYGVCVLLRNQANYNTIQNCTLDLNAIGASGSDNAYIAVTGSLTACTTSGDNANYLTIQNNTMQGAAYYGVTVYGASTSVPATSISILNNTIASVYYYGIRFYYATACTVQGNLIQDFYYYGIYAYYFTASTISGNDLKRPTRSTVTTTYGMRIGSSSSGVTVEKNRIHNLFDGAPTSTSTCYAIYWYSTGLSTAVNVVKNNAIYNMNGEGTQYGLYCSSANYVQFYHNTIALDHTASSTTNTTYAVYSSYTTSPGPDFANNIITITRGGTATKYGIYLSSTSVTGTSNYNDLYVNGAGGSNNVGYKGSAYATLAAWQGAGYDANSVAVDPVYENPSAGNLKPQLAAVNDIGTNLSTSGCTCVTDDILGNPRTTTPDLGAWEFTPVNMTYVSSTTTQAVVAPVPMGAANQRVIGVEVVTNGVNTPLNATSFTFSTNGSTAASDITEARLFYTGLSSTFDTTTQVGSAYAAPSGAFTIAGTQQLQGGTNYFWLAYSISPTATVNDVVDAECSSLTVGSAYAPTVTAPTGTRTILGALNGTYTVGTGGTFGNLSEASDFAAASGLAGNVTFNVISNVTEPGTAVYAPASGAYATLIQPSGGSFTITGDCPGSAVIKLPGTDNVTIDGLNAGGNALAVVNSSSAASSAAVWLASQGTGLGATNVTIRNCALSTGSMTTTSTFGIFAGGTSISTSGTGADNDNLTISGNVITKAYYGIYAQGTTAGPIDNLAITGNTVGSTTATEQIGFHGINVANASGALISQNDVFGIVGTVTSPRGINAGAGFVNSTIVRNTVHAIRYTGPNGYSSRGIDLNTGVAASGVVIANNMVYDILADGDDENGKQYCPAGIAVGQATATGGVGVYYNSVYLYGDASNGGSTYVAVHPALYIGPFADDVSVRNNILVSTMTKTSAAGSKTYAIYVDTVASVLTAIDNNDYYANSGIGVLGYQQGDHPTLAAWQTATGQDANSIAVDPLFTSTTNLHINAGTTPSPIESGAAAITGIAIDIDNDARPGPSGSTNGGGTWPDMGADEFDGVPTDIVPPSIVYTPLTIGLPVATRSFAGVAITDLRGVNTASGTRPRVYYKKGGSSNSNEWNDNTSATAGWKWVEANGTTSPFDYTIDYTKLPGGSVSIGDTIQYVVVAQDQWATPNVGINAGSFAAQPASVALTAAAFPIGGSVNQYRIGAGVSGTIAVGTGQTYTTLTAAGGLFEMLNNSAITGDVTVNITSDISTEDGAVGLNALSGAYRLQIQPDAASTRTVSGSAANSLIRINGAIGVTIDGTYPSSPGRYLVLRNTNAAYPTVELLGDASANRILNCVVEGANTSSTSGVVVFGAASTGNSNNAVIGCDIRDRSDVYGAVPANLVYSSSPMNAADTLANNRLHNHAANAVYAPPSGCGNGWQILSNGFYQDTARSTALRGVYLLAGGGHAIIGNNFGGSAPDRSGGPTLSSYTTSPAVNPIYLQVGTAAATTVSGNVIGNIECSGAGFNGIYISGGDVNVTGNRIGSASASSDTVKGAGTMYNMYNSGTGSVTFSADTVGYVTGTSTAYGIYCTDGSITAANNLVTHISSASTLYGTYISSTLTNSVTGNVYSDLTGMGSMYIIYCAGTGPTNTIANNTVQDIWNRTTGTSSLYGLYSPATGTNTITGNTLQRLHQDPSGTSATAVLYGMYVTGSGLWSTIANNTVDSLQNTATNGNIRGINVTNSGGATIAGNTVSRLWAQNNAGTINRGSVGGIIATAGADTLVNNTIHSLHTAYDTTTTSTFTSAYGLDLASSSANGIVRGNLIYDVVNHNAGTKKTYTSLLLIEGTGAGTVVEKNRMYGLVTMGTGVATGTPPDNTPPIASAVEISGAANAVYRNNEIVVGDEVGNEAIVIGIDDLSTATSTYYYNSVYVGGANTSGTSRSAAYAREGASSVYATATLVDNLLYNKRTGGTGGHYAVMNPGGSTGWTLSDFNLLVSSSAATVGLWGATDCSFPTWKTQSGGDTYSLSTDATTLPSGSLFTAAGTGDLSIVTTNPECWYVNGRGIAGSASGSVADDFGATTVRSTTLGMATDIGADEFSTATTPPAATASAAPAASTTTTYSFAGQTMASITWGSAGTVPTAIDFRYYPGENPPPPLQGNYSNAYATITATGGSGYTYDITFGYSPAILGTIPFESNLALAKRDASVWTAYVPSVVDTTYKTVSYSGLTGFSEFAFTDIATPLPVELVAFNAVLRGQAVDLAWRTASETNLSHFSVERRAGGGTWQELGTVTARGTTDRPTQYAFTDAALPAGDLAYRLRITDRDGSFSYSDELRIARGTVKGFALLGNHPNPFNPATNISFAIAEERYVVLRVYDPAGREVETLLSSTLPAGTHAVAFFARNLPSGVYRYVVTAGDEMKTGSMTLVR